VPINRFILDETILEGITSPNLYYPNSGMDGHEAIDLFSPHITEFYFVDRSYFIDRNFRRHRPANAIAPFLEGYTNYELIHVDYSEGPMSARLERRIDPKTGRGYGWIEPCTRSERYVHLPSNSEIVVHRRRGSGICGLKKRIDQLGVFYYRGDSSEGSNTPWLSVHPYMRRNGRYMRRVGRKHPFDEVLDRIVDKGLIVTEGSWCEYGELLEFNRAAHYGKDDVVEAIVKAESFTDSRRFSFECVGYAGHRRENCASLIWQVRRPESLRW